MAEPPKSTNSNNTPSLVLPAEEANKEMAPKTKKEEPPISILNEEEPYTEQTDDGSLSGNFLSSYVAHSQGDVPSAIRFLRESYAKDPTNDDLAGQLLVLELTYGKVNEATTIAKKLSTHKNHELIVDLLMSIDAVKQKDLAKAKLILSKAESGSFDHIWLPLLLGWMEPEKKDFKQVKPEELVSKGDTIPTFILYHAALLNDYRGHHELAKTQYQAATKDLSRAPFRALLAFAQMSAKDEELATLKNLMSGLDEKRPEMAELLYRELPYLQHLDGKQALPKTLLVNTASEGVAEVLLTMASMLYTLDTSQDIPLYLQLALNLKPDFPTAQLMLGNYYEALDLWQEAGAQYQQIRPTSPLFLKAGLRRAYILEQQKKPDQAEALLDGFIAQFPESIEAVTSKGDLLRNRSDFSAAIPYYDKAITMLANPDAEELWTLYFARGACYERTKQLDLAEIDLKKSMALAPNQPEVLNYLGYMWLDTDQHVDEAFEMIKSAYKLAPDQPHIIDSMGTAFLKTGKLAEAIALFESAAELLANDPTINEHLGDAYWYAGRRLEAKYQWQRSLDFAESDENKPTLEAKIKDGLPEYHFTTHSETVTDQEKTLDSKSVLREDSAPMNNKTPDKLPAPVSGTPVSPAIP